MLLRRSPLDLWVILFRQLCAGASMIKIIYSSSISSIVTVIFTVIITILAEFSDPLKTVLKNISGHHWTTKSIFVAIIYLGVLTLIYSVCKNPSKSKVKGALSALILVSVLGSLSILSFFVWHYLQWFFKKSIMLSEMGGETY